MRPYEVNVKHKSVIASLLTITYNKGMINDAMHNFSGSIAMI